MPHKPKKRPTNQYAIMKQMPGHLIFRLIEAAQEEEQKIEQLAKAVEEGDMQTALQLTREIAGWNKPKGDTSKR